MLSVTTLAPLEQGGGGGGHIPVEGTHDWVLRLSGPLSTSMPFHALPPHPIFATGNPFLTLCAQYPVVALCGDILNQLLLPDSRYTAKMYRTLLLDQVYRFLFIFC